jgi:exopolysaccharide production protein ExoQ
MQDDIAHTNQGISHLVITWALMVPLVYYASQGAFWFQREAPIRGFGALALNDTMGHNVIIATSICLIIVVLILSKLSQIVSSCITMKWFTWLSILALASTAWSQFPLATIRGSIYLVLNTLFAFYLYWRFKRQQLMKLLYLLGWVCLGASLVLIVFFPQFGVFKGAGEEFWQGIYLNKNQCSMMTVFFLAAACYVKLTGIFARLLRLLQICLSVSVIVMSQSRTGWVLLACLMAYLSFDKLLHRFRADNKIVVAVFSAAIVLPLVAGAVSNWRKVTYYLGKDPTLTGRTQIWNSAIESAIKRPMVGYGYEAFWNGLKGESANASLMSGWAVSSTHNGWLAVWLTLGAIGVSILFCTLFKGIKDAIRCLSADASSYFRWCSCMILLTLVLSMDEEQMLVPNDLTWILYIVACIGLSEGAKRIRLGQNHA